VWIQRLSLRLQTLFHRNRTAQQLDAELQFHLDEQIAENVAAGMSREEAQYAAMRAFGNPTVLKEQTRSPNRELIIAIYVHNGHVESLRLRSGRFKAQP